MWRRISVLVIGVILVITIVIGFHGFPVRAQGDYRDITRVQEDKWCTDHGFDGVTARDEHPQTVNSFPFCKGKDGNLYQVDMTQLCRDLFGDAYANRQSTSYRYRYYFSRAG